MALLTSSEINDIISGTSSPSVGSDCSCEGLHHILRGQGLTYEQFLLQADPFDSVQTGASTTDDSDRALMGMADMLPQ